MINPDGWITGKIFFLWGIFLYIVASLFYYAPRDWVLTVALAIIVGVPLAGATRTLWRHR